MTKAHVQQQTIHVTEFYPDHEPRESDPHYKLFEVTRARLKRLGLLVCWRCGAADQIQLHHAVIEFALANGVDIEQFAAKYPEFHVTDDESFARFVESEGNLLPLCKGCHIGEEAIHLLPYPLWVAGRCWRTDLPRPAAVTR